MISCSLSNVIIFAVIDLLTEVKIEIKASSFNFALKLPHVTSRFSVSRIFALLAQRNSLQFGVTSRQLRQKTCVGHV